MLSGMCRSIKTLRPPYEEQVSDDDVRAAALQYVRKVSGYRVPSARNRAAFDAAVDEVAAATGRLLAAVSSPPRLTARGPVRQQGGLESLTGEG